jgi:large-conductance mechanosensitive channel
MLEEFKNFALRGNVVDLALASLSVRRSGLS